jgi:anaerobic selenocysteine-containing dehydrogenase
MSTLEIVKTVCTMSRCPRNCGIDVYVENGEVVEVKGDPEFPTNRGRLCAKGLAAKELLYHPDRLKYPMKREGERWVRIPWDEALETITGKLVEVKEKYGAKALAVTCGAPGDFQFGPLIQRFMNVYGSPNLVGGDLCFHPRILADFLTLGRMAFSIRDIAKTKCIVLWGENPPASNAVLWKDIADAKARGVKLIVIDPRFTTAAERADYYVQVLPGTDWALALGMLNVIIEEELYDKDFVIKWTVGFDELKERIKDYPPEKVQGLTTVPAETIRKVARAYATTKPAFLQMGNALDITRNSQQTMRTLAVLRAITGNIDVPGGNTMGPNFELANISLNKKSPPDAKRTRLGARQHPIFSTAFSTVPSTIFTETMVTGKPYPIKAAIICCHNPVLTFADTKKVKAGLENLELLVVMDVFMTETAKLAHIALPAATFLERDTLYIYQFGVEEGKPPCLVALQNKAVEPVGECWPDWKFWFELAKRLGYHEDFPWNDVKDYIDALLKPYNVTAEDLKQHPKGMYLGEPLRSKRYETQGFSTSSGKLEIRSRMLGEMGYDPLPVFREPSALAPTQPDGEFPLILMTGAKPYAYSHSSLRRLPSLQKIAPEPLAEIHTETAKKLGISNGEITVIETSKGKIEIKTKLTENIHPHCVSIQHGWDGANANILTGGEPVDPITASPNLKSIPCRVTKKIG